MKTKLTVTVDRDLIPKAKRYARSRGMSLSAVIENALRGLAEDEGKSFVDRWQGKFVLAERDDERYRALVKKYVHD
jgi:post-segregation antitoxin (ccd killing protein)